MIPESYKEWKTFITQDCGITLTEEYISMRLHALQDPQDAATANFREIHGRDQLSQTIQWFEQARSEVAST